MSNNEDMLLHEFFEYIYPNTFGKKPAYIRRNGESLYTHEIKCISIKICGRILDAHEKRIVGWGQNEEYRYRIRDGSPEVDVKIPTWNLLISTFGDEIEQVLFNIAYPGATISYHYGISKHCYRAHWCLQNNEGFVFDIEGEKKKWKEGTDNIFKFDDGNVNHGVVYEESNNSKPRIVCLIDIKKSYWNE